MIVQDMLFFLRDAFDTFANKVARGSATISLGNTTVVVTMLTGLTTYSVEVTPTSNPGGYWWVSGKTPTQFQINLAVAAPALGVGFDWVVKGA
jgi:hypothetical protein